MLLSMIITSTLVMLVACKLDVPRLSERGKLSQELTIASSVEECCNQGSSHVITVKSLHDQRHHLPSPLIPSYSLPSRSHCNTWEWIQNIVPQ